MGVLTFPMDASKAQREQKAGIDCSQDTSWLLFNVRKCITKIQKNREMPFYGLVQLPEICKLKSSTEGVPRLYKQYSIDEAACTRPGRAHITPLLKVTHKR